GFRDFLPELMRVRSFVLRTLRAVFESFGFEPLETPSLEYSTTLLGKYGAEADKLVYTLQDRGKRDVGLIYDLTVPIARVLATSQNEIKLPFKRYQIQRVWRAEKPQKGRYREILQCDVDTFGVASPLADAEIIAVIYTALKKLGFEKFTINVNSRKTLFNLLKSGGLEIKEKQLSILRTIDKQDKKSKEAIEEELRNKGLEKDAAALVLETIKKATPDAELEQVIDLAEHLGVGPEYIKFAPTLVRGLDYYTGPIFETVLEEPKIGSITGGGRYDNLIEQLGGPDTPAVGTSFGLDRICDAITELGLLKERKKPTTQVLVTIWPEEKRRLKSATTKTVGGGNSALQCALSLTNRLRAQNIDCEMYLNPSAKLDKQLKYADRKGIPFVVIAGPEEIKAGKLTLKNMATGEQEQLTPEELVDKLK
ncbi:histidine--tRNA ligase, partial [Candidatus Parcubacteria bacterium]|nr:histidine--tRNA ligase [Candidatus Parcubacteria bacterium]